MKLQHLKIVTALVWNLMVTAEPSFLVADHNQTNIPGNSDQTEKTPESL